jgi:hypothetical protein
MLLACLLPALGGCGSSSASSGTAKTPEGDALPTAIEHEPCDVGSSGAQKIDSNGDGKPDIIRVTSGGREVCRVVDLNNDNVPDSFIYFDGSGAIRRRESDFDRDGKIDEIAQFANGVVTRKDLETNLDGKLDTWDFYAGGKIHHRLRDSDGDGKVDQWWSWANPDDLKCAVISSDHNGDGKPDPEGVIDVCGQAGGGGAGADGGTPGAAVSEAGAPAAEAGISPVAAASAPDAGAASAPATATSDADAGTPETSAKSKKAGKAKKGGK